MQIKRKINDDKWTFKVVTSKEMAKQREDGEDIAGLCVPSERTIYIHEDHVEFTTVKHELFHAYFSYLYLDDTNELSLSNLEEIMANFFVDKSEAMHKKAKEITKALQKVINKESK